MEKSSHAGDWETLIKYREKKMEKDQALYNSRIINTYVELLRVKYSHLNVNQILHEAGMELYEVEDPAHWFTQRQVDAFYDALLEKTKNPRLPREAGRFARVSRGMGPIKQYALGLINPFGMFLAIDRISTLMTRGTVMKSRKTGRNQVEIEVVLNPGVEEKPYQCENRIGYFEGIVHHFTNGDVSIEHDTCMHKGGKVCAYTIKWSTSLSGNLKRIGKLGLLIGLPALFGLFFLVPIQTWGVGVVAFLVCLGLMSYSSLLFENKDLASTIKSQGETARNHLSEINKRYLNALLFQKIGELTSGLDAIDHFADNMARLLDKYLEFESGFIALANSERRKLAFESCFGLTRQQGIDLREMSTDLKQPPSADPMINAFKTEASVIETLESKVGHSQWLSYLNQTSVEPVQSIVFSPIILENTTIGVFAVCNRDKNRTITKSDINLLNGIAGLLANGIGKINAYRELRQSEEKYRTLIETTGTGFSVIDSEGRIKDANAEYVRLSGHKKFEEIEGRSLLDWTVTNSREENKKELDRCFEEGSVRNLEIVYRNPDGGTTPIDVNATVVEIDGIPYALSLYRDITEHKKAQQALIQSEKMTTVGGLAAGMAHEINNPLAGMLQTIQVLRNRLVIGLPKYEKLARQCGTTLEAIQTYHQKIGIFTRIEQIISAGSRATNIVKNIINFSQKDEAHFVCHDIATLLDETIEIAKSDYSLQKDYDFREIEITRDYDPSTPKIPCSSSKIQQVFLNLLKNGAQEMFADKKSSRKPQFVVKVQNRNSTVRVVIADNGPGMDDATRKRIFEPFYTTKVPGPGLGLSISYFIIKENHGGEMMVESKPGGGSRFIINLPTGLPEQKP